MDISWPFWVSGLCGLLLSIITLALIFNSQFRTDISASEGKASIFNIISIEGAFILVLCGLLFSGLLYPVAFPSQTFNDALRQYSLANTKVNTFIQKHLALKEAHEQLQSSIQKDYIQRTDLLGFIKDLSPESDMARAIAALPSKQIGPWSPFPSAQEVSISIPSHGIKPGHALSCQEYFGKEYELIAQNNLYNKSVNITVDGYIYKSANCHKLISYDFQISCYDAQTLFGKQALSCDEDGEAKWFNKPKSLRVYLMPKKSLQTASRY